MIEIIIVIIMKTILLYTLHCEILQTILLFIHGKKDADKQTNKKNTRTDRQTDRKTNTTFQNTFKKQRKTQLPDEEET